MNNRRKERGFTLPELLVAVAVFGLMAVGSIFFLHPVDHSAAERDSERWLGVAQITQAISRYVAKNGKLPPNIPSDPVAIGPDSDMLDLCADLVPTYTYDLPFDPLARAGNIETACQKNGVAAVTGYSIYRQGNDTIFVDAPLAEGGSDIGLTRKY